MIAPPGCDRGAEHAAGMFRMAARPRHDVKNPHLQHVARLGVLHGHWPRADMHAKPLAGTATEHAGVHRARAATVHVLLVPRPAEHAFSGGIARDHQLGVVGGMLRQRLDGDGIARRDLELRRKRAAEITPMNAAGLDRKMMVLALGRSRRIGVGTGDIAARLRTRLMHAKLSERILWPAALTGDPVLRVRPLRLLLAKLAGRQAEAMAEGAAEMRGITETIGVGDLRDRTMRFRGVGQVGPGALEPPLADVMGKVVADR